MKNTLIFGLLVAISILSGCVKTRYVVVSPDQIQARIKKNQETQAQIAARQIAGEMVDNSQQQRWKRKLGLFCPIGGYEGVKIHPQLGLESRWLPPTPLGGFIRRTIYVLRATNTEDGPLDIEDTHNVLVANMCAKGSISLVKSMEGSELAHWGVQTMSNSYSMDVVWKAGGVTSKYILGYVESQRGVLYSNSWQQRQDATWLIKLKNENGKFF